VTVVSITARAHLVALSPVNSTFPEPNAEESPDPVASELLSAVWLEIAYQESLNAMEPNAIRRKANASMESAQVRRKLVEISSSRSSPGLLLFLSLRVINE